MSQEARTKLRVTEIGEYIRHRSCERRFKLDINQRQPGSRAAIRRAPLQHH